MKSPQSTYVNIVFPVPVDRHFLYAIPDELRSKTRVGVRVLAPFGKRNRELEGVIVEIPAESDIRMLRQSRHVQVKDVIDILDDEPFFSDELLKLTRWIADYYVSSWGEALKCAMPAGISIISKRVVSLRVVEGKDKVMAELLRNAPTQAQIVDA